MWSVGCLTTHAVSGAAVPRLPYGQARLALTSQGHLWAPQPTCGIQTALPNVLGLNIERLSRTAKGQIIAVNTHFRQS